MASFRERGGRWRAEVCRRGHPRLSATFASRKEAERWAKRTEAELIGGDRLERRRRTLSDAIDSYLQRAGAPDLSTYELKVLAWWRQQLGNKALSALRRADFYAARDRIAGARGQRLAPATLNKRLAAIAAVLTYAMHRDEVDVNVARIRRLPENNRRERLLDADERARLLEACRESPEPDLYPLVLCAMLSGARAGELVGLTWGALDLEKGIGRLTKTKSGQRRPIPLRGLALEALRALAESRASQVATDHVFRHADGKVPFDYGRAWRAARAEADIIDVRFHDLRHLAASTLAAAGTSSRELQEFLGHASAQMTQRYLHFVDQHMADLGDRLNDRLFRGS